jgi:hypothetical protein
MSHFSLRMGSVLHFLHPFAHRNRPLLSNLRRPSAARVVPSWESAHAKKEDLEFFGLCKKTSCVSDRAELDRLSLSSDDQGATHYMDEAWLSLL